MTPASFPGISRRRLLGAAAAVGGLAALPACGSSVEEEPSGKGGKGGKRAVKVGLMIPQSGTYAGLGKDMKQGWDLWLARHGGEFGGYKVTTVTADEGETPQTGVAAARKLLQSEEVDAVVGVVNSATALGCAPLVAEAQKLLLVANAGAGPITGAKRSPYVWRVSFQNAQIAAVLGEHLAAKHGKDGVYVIAPDYAAGAEFSAAFAKAFKKAGGKVAGSAKPPFATTTDYQPYLSKIRASGAKAVFCFFAGAEAIAFVKQYEQFGLADSVPLYGAGFLTEGAVLAAQGKAALGVRTSLHYSDQLDNPANKSFAAAYSGKYDTPPSVYAMQAWDAANVLDRALKAADDTSGDALGKALKGLGTIDDSPRGSWSFSGQNPKQTFYLRTVESKGGKLVNAVSDELGTTAQIA
ncbi:ABC transporter substrate-binding protein [Streptomyces sp. A7024]|uniref:ABC transporter substrate-binding protein n=1 Tax=Streptomyces coryli TaxID=1128680 RepID=A0A6G4U1H1_9ACTN|nr:ABC transporter substrate-binding protein [Streptomyces coryli]NGN65228.1 ABC transporter substrate-binding protein [Streptomyces coryli]